MKRAVSVFLLAIFSLVSLSGCAPILLGAAVGGVAMYAVGKDAIQGDTQIPYASLWDSALRIARARGTTLQEDFDRGYIEADVSGGKLRINLLRLTPTATKLRVAARTKLKLPDLALAEQVFVKTIEGAQSQSAPLGE